MTTMQEQPEQVCLTIHNEDSMGPTTQIKAFEHLPIVKQCACIATMLGSREQTPCVVEIIRLIKNVLNIYNNDVLTELHPALVHIFTVYMQDIQQILHDKVTDYAFKIRLETLEYINNVVYLQLNIYKHDDIERLIEMLYEMN